MAGRSLRASLLPRTLVLACALLVASAGDDGKGAKVQGKITYLWPIHFSSIALSGPGGDNPSLEPIGFGKELASIGMRGFKEYLTKTLPRELELDEELAARWAQSDHSRVNIAFQRWQKRVFADLYRVPAEGLTSFGDMAPRLEGINYSWPELYESAAFARLKSRIVELSRLYLKRSGYTDIPSKFRVFVWVEVYDKGDAMRPGSRVDGAYLAGRYFASVEKGSIKFNFEDPRGINPPFGKTYSHAPFEGNLVLHPVWNSYFMTPNMKSYPAISYAFLVYPAEGSKLNFQDDLTGDLKVSRSFSSAWRSKSRDGRGP